MAVLQRLYIVTQNGQKWLSLRLNLKVPKRSGRRLFIYVERLSKRRVVKTPKNLKMTSL